MKRESRRFTIDELIQAISNWELISKEFNEKLKIIKTTIYHIPLTNPTNQHPTKVLNRTVFWPTHFLTYQCLTKKYRFITTNQ